MDLTKIISVTGKSGLFKVVAQGRQALIVESLAEPGKRLPVPTSVRVSSLEEIHMFTTGDDVPLKDVLQKIYDLEKGKESADARGPEDVLWAKLSEALPTNDRERIHSSDVRKLFTWYGQLLKAGVFTAKEEKKDEKEEGAGKTAEKGEKKPKVGNAGVKKAAAPKPGGSATKAKATPMRKGSQRGS
ncbi:MAG: DUF5606 domain-containing protein [Flavobacteriales bacterium]